MRGILTVRRPILGNPSNEVDVEVELDWSRESGERGSAALAPGFYCNEVRVVNSDVVLTRAERDRAIEAFPWKS